MIRIMTMKLSGAEILTRSLSDHGIDILFGYPGSCVMQVLDNLYDNRHIRHILVRHEQGAIHAACGYAQTANKPGVVLVTSGPGATNTLTGIADAHCSGIPLLVITGQVPSHLLGTDAFQEADTISITAPITKWNYQIRQADQIADAVAKAFRVAVSGHPGPVLLDITKDAQTDKAEYTPCRTPIDCLCFPAPPTTALDTPPQKALYAEVVRILKESGKKIVLVVDKTPNGFYPHECFGADKVVRSATFNVPGFGLPAAIGAAYAVADRTICLVAGSLEFQATIKELGVIKQQGLDVKMILFSNTSDDRYGIRNPDFMQLIGAYGIKGSKIDEGGNLYAGIRDMLNSTQSYLLEIAI